MAATSKAVGKEKKAISRVLWKEIKQGDRRKFSATSNDDSSAGGGARDLRFRGGDDLDAIVEAMFPRRKTVMRRREGQSQPLVQHEGDLAWIDEMTDGSRVERSQVAAMEPPTTARPGEWRLTRVHTYPPLAEKIPAQPSTGRLFLLLVQTTSGEIWPLFVDEDTLRTGNGWQIAFRRHIIKCLNRPIRQRRTILGYFEANTGREYSNA